MVTVPKDVRQRRLRVHELLVIQGVDYAEVLDLVSEEFGVARSTVEDDVANMSDWVGDLSRMSSTGEVRLLELRRQRQRLYELIQEARDREDLDLERKLLTDLLRSITVDLQLSQSLGLTEPAGEIEIPEDLQGDEAVDEAADRDPAVLSASR